MPGDDELLAIASSVPIAKVVRQYVDLQPVGRQFGGRCPFHVEQTPSFMVRPSASTFRCFGCWAQGSVIEFVMRVEGLDFDDAVRKLATEAADEVDDPGVGN